jgi:hypothetical protein
MKAIKIDHSLLTKLRSQLPHGAQKRIAEKLAMDSESVGQVLRGKFYNPAVIEAALKEIETQVQTKKKIEGRISDVLAKSA